MTLPALLYHAHHSLHPDDLPFWLELADSLGGPVLELGCGTGRLLLPLTQAGHLVYGLDRDYAMLAALRQNLAQAAVRPGRVFQADMTCFHLELACGLVMLPCNTFSTLTDLQRLATLKNARRLLRPGGVLAVSLPNPVLLKRLPRRAEPEVEDVFPHPLDGDPVQVSSEWERTATHFCVRWHYDHLFPDGRVERFSASADHWLVPPQAYLQEFAAAGLRVVEQYGDYDRSAYTPRAPALIILARQQDF